MSEEEVKETPEQEVSETDETVEQSATEEAQQAPAEPTIEEQLAEMKDRYLRLRAEFDNYRKRMAREAMETREIAKCNVIGEFVTVYDYFQMALDHAEKGGDASAIVEGLKMISNQFSQVLANLGVSAESVIGKDFDPKYHEAVSQEPSDTVPEGKVLRQWKCLFKVGDRVVRPAGVVVSSGPAEEKKNEDQANND